MYSLGAGRERVIVSASAAGTYLPVSQISFPSLASCFCHHLFLHLLFQLEIASTFPSTISHTYRKDPETSRQKGTQKPGLEIREMFGGDANARTRDYLYDSPEVLSGRFNRDSSNFL